MKTITLFKITGTILFIIFIITAVTLMNKCENILIDEQTKYKNEIGTEIVLEKDTLMIIDYSFVNSNFILSNGQTINIELIDKLKLNE